MQTAGFEEKYCKVESKDAQENSSEVVAVNQLTIIEQDVEDSVDLTTGILSEIGVETTLFLHPPLTMLTHHKNMLDNIQF